MNAFEERRRLLLSQENCQFIEPDDFVRRATSRRSYVRADDPVAALSGLLDPETGHRLFVENEKLVRVAACGG